MPFTTIVRHLSRRRSSVFTCVAAVLQLSCSAQEATLAPSSPTTSSTSATAPTTPTTPSPTTPTTPVAPAATYQLGGTVRDSIDQRVIDRAEVSVNGKTATVWDDKVYRLELPAGTYTVTATNAGYAAETREVTLAGNTVIDFTLMPQVGTLRVGPLHHWAGSTERRVPCEGRVEIVDGPDAGRFAIIPPGGTNVIPNVSPGSFRVRASATGYKTVEMTHRFRETYLAQTVYFDMCPLGSGCDVMQPPCN